jgi:hypothetical protein
MARISSFRSSLLDRFTPALIFLFLARYLKIVGMRRSGAGRTAAKEWRETAWQVTPVGHPW